MIIQPKIRGFICTTAHPEGCKKAVEEQVNYVKSKGAFSGPKNVLVIGASTGYGLASRIVATFGAGAKTIGVFFEKEADEKRTASPGWYNSAAFEQLAHQHHYYAKSLNGDAFSKEMKERAADLIRRDMKQVDLIVYSLASPRRVHPETGHAFSSTLKPIGKSFTGKTIDAFRGEVKEVTIEPATEEEVANTVAVMGGEDWEMWIDFLAKEKLLAEGVKTVAYSYLGPELTHAIYKEGTIGKAKEHLKMTADKLSQKLKNLQGEAVVSVDKAVVTQASAAIPVVPLYISLLFKIMKEKGTHEGCIEQIYRLFKDHLYASHPPARDAEGYIRIDDLEMDPEVQQQIAELWPRITTENLAQLTDVKGYCDDFYRLFGFNLEGVDYNAEVDPVVKIGSINTDAVTDR
ncbi:enoyl-ACP reductase FabV [Aquicella lusitana]|uniref:Enoyl-[acyl-carrier-protein] reductase [NADH] n=1 Tax=Aquicella lusitana TaxID=254246 RepID=A0A370GLC0_9COXI|nr:enoyl-ACP reductase FabV [Aquicella lusitana]RDI44568.1 enoyl-[acyl-carrier protein] reductase/trans-2-enoyl-CoA reductase (NAD+) [Aquicella lusitana]VVC72490.1 Putative reductase/y4119/YP_4011 [Aquicella lusitana]